MRKYLYEIISSSGNLNTEDIIIRIAVAAALGCAIYLSYWITHSGSIYSRKFNVSLLILTVLTATVMTVIGNNVALSLGMVGALSIIRFRTSIKDSRDTVYIFWTIIVGICCGVGDYLVAGVGSSMVFLLLLLFGRVRSESRILLVIRAQRDREEAIRRLLYGYFKMPPIIKAQNTTETTVEFIYEVSRKMLDQARKAQKPEADGSKPSLNDRLYALGGIHYVNLVVQSDEIA
ncbi:MAG: DUF4956 domain-containing protein [Oscillospiraceae bacterium]|nr:DUF4956 domain-containing protein [Oscillospiraceae bacterium]